jgi:hypothetical protein
MSTEREQKLEAALHKVEDLALKLREERDKAFNEGRASALRDARCIVRDYIPSGRYAGIHWANQIDQRLESLQTIDTYLAKPVATPLGTPGSTREEK